MHRQTASCLGLMTVGLTSLAWSSASRAATAKPLTWWIETRPWTCSAEAGPLARQVQLACDATGRCAIASDEPSADRRAVLVCGDDGWTLEARDAKDEPLWSLVLGATDDDARLRKAGVWIARSEGEGPIDLPPSTTVATRPSAAPPSISVAPEGGHAPDDPGAAHLSLAAMFHSAIPRNDRQDYGLAWGGRALLVGTARRTTGPLLFGVAGTAEYSSARTDYSLVRGGLLLGLDAAVGDFRFGLMVEGGPAMLRVAQTPMDGVMTAEPQSKASASVGPQSIPGHDSPSAWLPYAQASLFAQWSLPGSIHPLLSPTVTWLIDRGAYFPTQIPNAIVGLDLGFTFGHI